MAASWSSYKVVVGSHVKVSEVKCNCVNALLSHSSLVGARTLSNEVTPRKASGSITVCAWLSGSGTVSACECSVGSRAKNFVNDHVINSTLHRAEEVMVKMGNMDGLVDH